MARIGSTIILVGPTSPLFKGGISHYTYNLYKELESQKKPVELISFSRAYPKQFFPGATTTDKSKKQFKVDEKQLLDWANPLSWFKVYRYIKNQHPQVLILQWWTWFFTLPYLTILFLTKTLTNIKIVIIAHNPVDHEANLYKKLSANLVLKQAHKIVVHNSKLQKELSKLIKVPVIMAFHPIYDMFRLGQDIPKSAQAKLKVDSPLLLFFGHVRPYKGLDILLNALSKLWQKNIKINLLIAGEFWQNPNVYLDKIKSEHKKFISIENKYIKNEEVEMYFRAADAVVIPYLTGTGSGPAKIALSFGKPIIATNVGDNADLFKIASPGVLVESKSSALEKGIVKVLKTKSFEKEITEIKKQLTWSNLVNKILNEE